MSSAVAKLSKPVMRGMHVNEIKRNIAGAALVHMLILFVVGSGGDGGWVMHDLITLDDNNNYAWDVRQ